MNSQILLLLAGLAVAIALPSNIVDFETDLMDIEQEGIAGKAVKGEYSWVAPNGQEVYVKYVADKNGFRVLDSENTIAGGGDFDTPEEAPKARAELPEEEEEEEKEEEEEDEGEEKEEGEEEEEEEEEE